MINAASFDMGSGPDLKGTWKNYRTGEVITIRDTIFENNQLVGVSSGGAMIPYSKLQSFVKCDPSEASSSIPTSSNKTHRASPKPFVDNINDIYKDSDKFDGPSLKTDAVAPREEIYQNIALSVAEKKDPAIEKVLDGLAKGEQPKITVDLKWDEIPEGIVFLQKYLEKSTEEISIACIQRYVDLDKIRGAIEEKLQKAIAKGLNQPPKEKETKETKKTKS